ncbi:hypothetical protein AB3N61_18280 [Leptospira sp. WS58.C1]|uniref:hypothetical protein n=1 Tax=Leptospira cinconiae TaxID=3235173 RepID=UPI00349EB7C1
MADTLPIEGNIESNIMRILTIKFTLLLLSLLNSCAFSTIKVNKENFELIQKENAISLYYQTGTMFRVITPSYGFGPIGSLVGHFEGAPIEERISKKFRADIGEPAVLFKNSFLRRNFPFITDKNVHEGGQADQSSYSTNSRIYGTFRILSIVFSFSPKIFSPDTGGYKFSYRGIFTLTDSKTQEMLYRSACYYNSSENQHTIDDYLAENSSLLKSLFTNSLEACVDEILGKKAHNFD